MARQTQTQIESAIAVDPPLVQDAEYRLDAIDRQYLDSQVRGCERHLVDSLLSGVVCTWQEVDSTSASISVGDATVATTHGKVAKATAALLAAAGSAYGIAVTTGVRGGKVRIAIGGRVPSTVTGLAAAAAGFARVNTTTARLEKVASYGVADWPVGIIDTSGTLAIDLPLQQGGTVAGTGRIGDSKTLYVDKGGNNATAQRGNIGLPYLTITAALAAAQSGDVVCIGPGTWTEDVTLPELAEISLVGAGRDQTRITGVAADATIQGAPTTTELQRCLIADLTAYNPGVGVGYAIDITGSGLASPGNFLSAATGLVLRGVRTITDASVGNRVRCAGRVDVMPDCDLDGLSLRAVGAANVGGVVGYDGTLSIAFDPADTLPTGYTKGTATLLGCRAVSTAVSKLANVTATGSDLGAVTGTLTTDGGDFGYITANACKLGAVAISGDSADTGANLSASSMASLAVTRSAGAERVAVSARGGAIAGAVSAGNGCDIDIRGSSFVQSSLAAVGDGTIERSRHRQAIALPDSDPLAIALTPPFTTSAYTVAWQQASGSPALTSALTASGFTAMCGGGDPDASFMILHD